MRKKKFNRRLKDKNAGYFKVGNMVFKDLREAEMYCWEKNLDVDEHIKSGTPAILLESLNICRTVLPVLDRMEDQIGILYREKYKEKSRRAKEYRETIGKRDLLKEYKQEQLIRSIALLEGIWLVREIVNKEKTKYQKILSGVK